MSTAVEAVLEVLASAQAVVAGSPHESEVQNLVARFDDPVRIAIAGRVKAGKSTLLNALVGERLAPTDAGECTKLVTWYQEGPTYRVAAHHRDGTVTDLPFNRDSGALEIRLDHLQLDDIDHLEVSWPSSALHHLTLIDTPGLGSLDDRNSLRTREFLAMDDETPAEADAVIYLMRHLHRRDAEFLGSFMDRSVVNASSANAIGVLSRADEVAAGRRDAMASAERIASRYRGDEQVRQLCLTVVPVAGLIAETGLTLSEHEVATLRELAATPTQELADLLLSADLFCDPSRTKVAPELRRELLARLGMFGLRFSLIEIQQGRCRTAVELARALVDVSGLDAVRSLLLDHFAARGQVLKARSALLALRRIASRLGASDPDGAIRLEADIERVEAGAHEFAEMRLLHLLLAGLLNLTGDEMVEVVTVARGELRPDDVATAIAGVERWRARGESPVADPALREAASVLARSYEAAYMELVRPN